jgi:hypothetical protein
MSEHSKIWKMLLGEKQEYSDYTGRKVRKEAYNQENSQFGWVVELINPNKEAEEGNLQIVNIYTNTIRNDRVNFSIDGIQYRVEKDGKEYKIKKVMQEQNKDSKQLLWQQVFGNKKSAWDFCGREIHRDTRDWNVDHIMPLSLGGGNTKGNLQIAHIESNKEKADKTTFWANGKPYQVQRNNGQENENYDYTAANYCIVEIEQEAPKLTKNDVWDNEFGKKKDVAQDYDEVAIHRNGNDWVVELLNPDGESNLSNVHIVSKVINEIRNGRNIFSVHDNNNKCVCYYRLRKNDGSLSKKDMSDVYDYTKKDYYFERYDIDFDEDDDDYGDDD